MPSAAPTLAALLDTQAIFETALAAYLTANGITAYTTQDTDNLPDARVTCEYQVGPSTGHQATAAIAHTGANELDWFNGIIQFTVTTERAKVGVSPDVNVANLHRYWCATIRRLMLRGSINGTITGTTALSLPYHIIVVQGFLGQQDSIPADGFDESILGFAVQVQILADAWPAAVAP